MSQNMRKFGNPNRPKSKVQGRPRTLAPEVLEVNRSFVGYELMVRVFWITFAIIPLRSLAS